MEDALFVAMDVSCCTSTGYMLIVIYPLKHDSKSFKLHSITSRMFSVSRSFMTSDGKNGHNLMEADIRAPEAEKLPPIIVAWQHMVKRGLLPYHYNLSLRT